MLEAGSIVCSANICVALIRFQLMEVVVQQILFNLGSSQRKAQPNRPELYSRLVFIEIDRADVS